MNRIDVRLKNHSMMSFNATSIDNARGNTTAYHNHQIVFNSLNSEIDSMSVNEVVVINEEQPQNKEKQDDMERNARKRKKMGKARSNR